MPAIPKQTQIIGIQTNSQRMTPAWSERVVPHEGIAIAIEAAVRKVA